MKDVPQAVGIAEFSYHYHVNKIKGTHGDEELEELKNKIRIYITYYNTKRIKQKLAGMSPVEYRLHISQLAA